MEEVIILNGKEISKKEFEEKKKEIEEEKGVQLVEVQKNVYKTRILG